MTNARNIPTDRPSAADVAENVGDHPALHLLGRVGLVAYGLVHLGIAVLAARLAFGDPGRADKAGALQAVAGTGFGRLLLWIVTAGLVALVLWQLAEVLFGHRGLPPGQRARRTAVDLAEAVVFGLLAKTAADVAVDGGATPTSTPLPSMLLALPGGAFLLGLAGIGLVAVAGYAVYRGLSDAFLRDLDLRGAGLRRSLLVRRLGRIGWPALGATYATSGVLLTIAAVRYDPAQPVGLDAGLKELGAQPFGPLLLSLLAVGLAVFGVYALFDARYRAA
ncbi:MAG: DUF1206 domain-containing protein [Pseudonocardia sp.]|nr:DUF1206 domain-containing protein [Pseudonocardia sp.]